MISSMYQSIRLFLHTRHHPTIVTMGTISGSKEQCQRTSAFLQSCSGKLFHVKAASSDWDEVSILALIVGGIDHSSREKAAHT